MKVSRNEMNAALMRAYEGAGYAIGDYEEAAEMITWSEMCGLGGFAAAEFPLQAPQADQLPRLDYERNGIAVIDAGSSDVCQYGSLAAQLACSLASREGQASVHLVNCRNAKLILSRLAKIAAKGYFLVAYWNQDGVQYGASFDGAAAYPDFWESTSPVHSGTTAQSSVTILCSPRAGVLSNGFQQAGSGFENELQLTPATIVAGHYDRALNNGISVDPEQWAALNKAAWPILVSATQQSSLGAGPG